MDGCSGIHIIEPIDVLDCHNFEARCHLCLTDSGGIQEECPSYGVPVLVMRDTTERPEALDKACFVLSGITTAGLLQAVNLAVSMNENGDYGIPVPDYVDLNVSTKVVKIIQSYKDTVNKFVWRKEV